MAKTVGTRPLDRPFVYKKKDESVGHAYYQHEEKLIGFDRKIGMAVLHTAFNKLIE